MKSSDSSLLIQIGAWRVDGALDEISRDGQTTKLEPKMMQLLLCLAAHAGQVVSVEQLLDEIWKDVVVTPDSVYHAIAALRRVLGDDSKAPTYIANVMRRGYRLIAPVVPLGVAEAHVPPALPPHPAAGTQSVKPAVEARQSQAAPRRTARRIAIATVAVLAAVAASLLIDRLSLSKRVATPALGTSTTARSQFATQVQKSIAVLPFVDLSEKHDQEYFADGMAEEVIDLLTNIPGLKVIGRTSSFQFKGKNQDLRAVGNALGARYLVEGSVRRAGDQARVTAQLIDTADGSHVWSHTYDEPMRDVVAVQDQIAAGLVSALQLSIELETYEGGRHSFKSSEAYDLYLRGEHARLERGNKAGIETAATYLQRAVDLEPGAVPAVEALAWAQLNLAELSYVEPQQGFERARQLAQQALTLDPKSPGAHRVLSSVHFVYDWDWAAAEKEAQEAARVQPHDPDSLSELAELDEVLGRFNDGIRHVQAALAVDPFDPALHLLLSNFRAATGDLGESEAEARTMLQISPNFGEGHYDLGGVLLLEGNLQAALAEMQREQTAASRDAGLAMVYHSLGRHTESDAALAGAVTEGAQGYAWEIADAYAWRGQADQAFAWLDRAYRQKDAGLYLMKVNMALVKLKSDPRYAAFLRKMHMPE
ncbi:MAG: winged helix-turn-helix domain-containing protein [Gammaproteobacteria bacterium]|nr:winged helix-turn-helix domain-containing protein [Gammaproteobacteria bacterium]